MVFTFLFGFVWIYVVSETSEITAELGVAPKLPKASNRLINLPTYVFAWLDELKAQARAAGQDLIDLGMGNPDQPTPQPVIEAIQAAFNDIENHRYPPFWGKPNFRQAVANWMQRRYGVTIDPEREVLAVSGTKEGLVQLTNAYIGKDEYSLVPTIYYPIHGRATWLMEGHVHHLPMTAETNFLVDFDTVPEAIAEKAKLLFLNYPNNPTGAVAPLDFYEKAVAFCRRYGIILVGDMAYCDIAFDSLKPPSILQIPGAKDITVEFYSFSKTFSMAGSRLGFAVGQHEVLKNLYTIRTNVGYGSPPALQDGGAYALDHAEELVPPIVATYQHRRDLLAKGFQALGWPVHVSKSSMYMWLPVPEGFDSKSWVEYLIREAGVVVTPGNAFGIGGEGYFRVSLVAPDDVLLAGLERLKQAGVRFQ
jgi:LL-diaminopimelate aminotransferase